MKILSDYKCRKCNHEFEHWTDNKGPQFRVNCPECLWTADRQITGGNFELPGHDLGFPTAADKWARRHRNANKHNLKELGLPT